MRESISAVPDAIPRPPRTRLRFSLTKLLFAMLVVAFFFACIGSYVKQALDRRNAVERLKTAGATITFSGIRSPWIDWLRPYAGDSFVTKARVVSFKRHGATPGPDAESMTRLMQHVSSLTELEYLLFDGQEVTDSGVRYVSRLKRLKGLHLERTCISDDGLACLEDLPQLESLRLDDTQVTDAGMGAVARLSRLNNLSLKGTAVTDQGVKALSGLTELQYLLLSDTQVSSAGLAHVSGLTQLELLDLENTQVTDDGLPHLRGIRSLSFLGLRGTRVSREKEQEMKEHWPRLLIVW